MPSSLLVEARENQRTETMRAIAEVAIRLFHERGFPEVTIDAVARAAGVSPATIYRRFGTKENLVCWHPDEQRGLQQILERLRSGMGILDAALDLVDAFPDQGVDSVESTGRMRLELISTNPQLSATARAKMDSFAADALAATKSHDRRSLLRRETEIACVAVAMHTGTRAWARGDGPLRACMQEALSTLQSPG